MADSCDGESDETLVDCCNRGNADAATRAFESLYRRHRSYVLRIALRFIRERELAADVLQETFIVLLRQFPPAGAGLTLTARLTTYLYPIAKNLAISAARKGRRLVSAGDDLLESLPAPETASGGETIDLAIEGLPAERREVLTLRFADGLSLEEIAQALDVPLGTVKSRLHLALKTLRDDPRIRHLYEP